jgi:GTP-binding protein
LHRQGWKDIIIEVPLGTIAKDEETGKVEAEMLEDGQEIIWLKGGRGGWKFKFCNPNKPGA